MKNKNFLFVLVIVATVVTLISASFGMHIVKLNPEVFTVQVKPSAIIGNKEHK